MPYIRDGKCVYKKNPDGSKGEKRGCSETEEKAKAHMRALYAAENKGMAEMSMAIVKASREKSDGTMRLRLVNSDTGPDVFDERMSLELFEDFVRRSDENLPVPEPFRDAVKEVEQGWWEGGPPYLSIAHFRSGAGKNVPGKQEKLYIDGEKLKSVDVLFDTDLGNAVWKSVYEDLYEEEKSFENPVRVSIGFLDLEHKHELEDGEIVFTRNSLEDRCQACADGLGNKVYLKGHLVHKAFTRVPANQRTLVEVEVDKAEGIITKKDDAKSIIGDIELEEKSVAVDDIMVVKAEEGRDQEPLEEVMDEIKQEEVVEEPVQVPDETVEVEAPVEEVIEEPIVEEPIVEPEKSKIDIAVDNLKSRIAELKEKGVYGEEALKDVQPLFNAVAEGVKAEVTPQGQIGDVASIIRSTIQEIVPTLKEEIVKQLVTELGGLAQTKSTPVEVPAPRSISLTNRSLVPEKKEQLSAIDAIAKKSVGL